MGSFRNLELCRRPPPCPFGNACRNVHASQGKNIGIIKNTKTNLTLYRRTHQSYIHEPKRPAKEDTEEEHLSKKEESEVYVPGLRLQDGPTCSRSPPSGQGQEVDTDRNKAVEGRAAKGSNTPLTDYQQTSYQQGHRHDTSGMRFI